MVDEAVEAGEKALGLLSSAFHEQSIYQELKNKGFTLLDNKQEHKKESVENKKKTLKEDIKKLQHYKSASKKQTKARCKARSNLGLQKEEKSLSCPKCPKSFKTYSELKRHDTVHSKEQKFTCLKCDDKFAYSTSVKYHMRIHTGEKPYKCEKCEKTFRQSSNLHVHNRVHTGERPFACITCQKSYKRKWVLTVHMRTHTGEKPYPCGKCHKAFKQLGELKCHQLRKHKLDTSENERKKLKKPDDKQTNTTEDNIKVRKERDESPEHGEIINKPLKKIEKVQRFKSCVKNKAKAKCKSGPN